LDLATRPNDAGGLSNVATVVGELAEDGKLEVGQIEAAAAHFALSSVRRLGWLLDAVDSGIGTDRLRAWVESMAESRPGVVLDPAEPRRGRVNPRWGIIENSVVEPDL
jgi:predicted transcriptional regulator of viral defense system